MPRRILIPIALVAAAASALMVYWRWFPRAGLRWTNERLNPWLVTHGWVGAGRSELGSIEHVGRRTGTRHVTPVHPVPTLTGFRIVVPLAERSEWALNVLAAGHCRLQLHDVVYELDEPELVRPADIRDLPAAVRWLEARLGFRYLRLHTFGEATGTLEPEIVAGGAAVPATPEPEPERETVAAH